MFFFKDKSFTTHQTAIVGFALAIFSMLITAFTVFVLPLLGAYMNKNGVSSLDLFYLAFCITFFLSMQGLILFGFPLYYAQDKKSHMTGFKILIFAILWTLLLTVALAVCTVKMQSVNVDDYSLEDMMGDQGVQDAPADTGVIIDESAIPVNQ
jgi:hypothetical protein